MKGLSLKGMRGGKGGEERLVNQALRYFFPSHAFLHGIFIIYNPVNSPIHSFVRSSPSILFPFPKKKKKKHTRYRNPVH